MTRPEPRHCAPRTSELAERGRAEIVARRCRESKDKKGACRRLAQGERRRKKARAEVPHALLVVLLGLKLPFVLSESKDKKGACRRLAQGERGRKKARAEVPHALLVSAFGLKFPLVLSRGTARRVPASWRSAEIVARRCRESKDLASRSSRAPSRTPLVLREPQDRAGRAGKGKKRVQTSRAHRVTSARALLIPERPSSFESLRTAQGERGRKKARAEVPHALLVSAFCLRFPLVLSRGTARRVPASWRSAEIVARRCRESKDLASRSSDAQPGRSRRLHDL
jgi:hypothetical protein